jgi:Formyl transferase
MEILMRVLVLSPFGDILDEPIVKSGGVAINRPPYCEVSDWPQADFVVSFGYRKIIPAFKIEEFQGRIINIHMSLLPWNRGAHPNFWSWFDCTPKGVTIHRINKDLDKGEVLAQRRVYTSEFRYGENATLRSTYDDLVVAACGLFDRTWPQIINRTIDPVRDYDVPVHDFEIESPGSYHKHDQINRFERILHIPGLPDFWDRAVSEIEYMGALYRETET